MLLSNMKLIEIKMVNGQTTYSFGDQKTLRGRRIRALVVLSGGNSTGGSPVQDPTNGYLYLKENDSNDIRQVIPAKLINYSGTYPILAMVEIDGRRYNWEESEIKFSSAPTAGSIFQIAVVYDQEQSV